MVILFSFSMSRLLCEEKKVKVITQKANIYLEPDFNSTIIETVKKGTILNLFQSEKLRKIWYYVFFYSEKRAATVTGFIQASFVEKMYEMPKIIEEEKKELTEKVEEVVYKSPQKIKVIRDEANIRLMPDFESQVIQKVQLGTILQAQGKIAGWYRINLPPIEEVIIISGYIHKNFVQEIIEKDKEVIKVEEKKPVITPPPKPTVTPRKKPSREEIMKPKSIKKRYGYIKIGINYFSPSEQSCKDIYGEGLTYEGEITFRIWRGIELWLGGSYSYEKGELTFTKEETKLSIFPIGGGVKYRLLTGTFNLYTGIGLSYYQLKESNPIGDASKGGLGYKAILGGFISVNGGFLIDFHINYTYCKMTPADIERNIGGLGLGCSLGFEF